MMMKSKNNIINSLKNFIKPHRGIIQKWKESNGDKVLRLDYPLDESSIVFDIGGYEGGWTDDIYNNFKCNIYVFEPVKNFYEKIVLRFKKNKKIKVFQFGLSKGNSKEVIFLNVDSSSLYGKGEKEIIEIRDFKEFIKIEDIKNINLLKMNIEGAEYLLLEGIIDEGLLNMFENIQIQFHKNVDDYKGRRDVIRKHLSKTHKQEYNFPFVWESWSLKN